MEILKNFFVGLFIIAAATIALALISLAWPILIGIGSFVLTIVAAVLFLVLIFYLVVLVGFAVRRVLKKEKKCDPQITKNT